MMTGTLTMRSAFVGLAMATLGLVQPLWGVEADPECLDDTPLSQAASKCILDRLSTERTAAAIAPLRPVAQDPLQVRIGALKEAMAGSERTAAMMLAARGYPSGHSVYTAAVPQLQQGALRGRITYPLYRGTIGATKVYFVLTDASDQEFAREFGVTHATRLADIDPAGIEEGTKLSADGQWVFAEEPGRVVHIDENGKVQPAIANPKYSPVKRITWRNREVLVNIPFVQWGEGPGQTLIVDEGRCDPRIRGGPPNRSRVGEVSGGGPNGCAEAQPDPLRHYRGGQVLKLEIGDGECPTAPPWKPCGWVTMKLHQAVYRQDIYPYITVFAASEAAVAEELGVLHAPKLARAGRSSASPPLGLEGAPAPNTGVSSIVEFHNGVETPDGGPEGFQPGAISYGEPTWSTYSPLLHVIWAYIDCAGNGQYLRGAACKDVAVKLAGNPYGRVYRDRVFSLWNSRMLMLTDSSGGVLDAPSPLSIAKP